MDTVGSTDREDLLDCLHRRDLYRSIDKQRAFFETHCPEQPIYLAELHRRSAAEENREACEQLRLVWKRLGWSKRLPTVRDLAQRASLLELYDYLYTATSRIVHFTRHSLFRLGWCETAGTNPEKPHGSEEYSFSLTHFARYHGAFTRFYAAFLFLRLYDLFSARFPSSKGVTVAIAAIRKTLNEPHRWPEVVTFEEMNVRLDEGVHFFEFTKAPLATTLMKGLPKSVRRLRDQHGE